MNYIQSDVVELTTVEQFICKFIANDCVYFVCDIISAKFSSHGTLMLCVKSVFNHGIQFTQNCFNKQFDIIMFPNELKLCTCVVETIELMKFDYATQMVMIELCLVKCE